MTAPSLLGTRWFPHPLRLRLQVLFARAFEALTDTYRAQAVNFVGRLSERLSMDEALDRYFHEVGVPHAMEQTVRARALIALAPTFPDILGREPRSLSAWMQLRPDQLIDAIRRRAQLQEDTSLECRMAASVADEAIGAMHARMAIETVALLEGEVSPDDAIMHYVRHFNLPSVEAQIIFRRALAACAERHPVRAPFGGRPSVCAPPPSLSIRPRTPLGLRAAS